MQKIEADLIQTYIYYKSFLISSIRHAELRAKELEKKLELYKGKESRFQVVTLQAKAEYYLERSDSYLAWLIDRGEKVGIVRWFLRKGMDAKHDCLRLTQEIKAKIKQVEHECAISMAGVIFKIEEDAQKLMMHPEVFREEEERRELLEKMEEFDREIEERVREKVRKLEEEGVEGVV
jgi:hypothetical protein